MRIHLRTESRTPPPFSRFEGKYIAEMVYNCSCKGIVSETRVHDAWNPCAATLSLRVCVPPQARLGCVGCGGERNAIEFTIFLRYERQGILVRQFCDAFLNSKGNVL